MSLPRPGDPLFQPWRGPGQDLEAAAEAAGLRPRWTLQGAHMRTKAALLAEWAAAVPFPPHFGHTWDSLRDALADLPEGGTFLVLGADQLLADGSDADRKTLEAILGAVREDLSPRPFRLLMQVTAAFAG